MDYRYYNVNHHIVAIKKDGTKKVIYSYHKNLIDFDFEEYNEEYFLDIEINYGSERYTYEYDCECERVRTVGRKLNMIQLDELYSFFINYKDIEKISENILLLLGMNNMQMDEIDSLIVYASFEESIEHCNIKRYDVDFVINKKSAEEWNALGDKEKEDLEFDFSDYTLE